MLEVIRDHKMATAGVTALLGMASIVGYDQSHSQTSEQPKIVSELSMVDQYGLPVATELIVDGKLGDYGDHHKFYGHIVVSCADGSVRSTVTSNGVTSVLVKNRVTDDVVYPTNLEAHPYNPSLFPQQFLASDKASCSDNALPLAAPGSNGREVYYLPRDDALADITSKVLKEDIGNVDPSFDELTSRRFNGITHKTQLKKPADLNRYIASTQATGTSPYVIASATGFSVHIPIEKCPPIIGNIGMCNVNTQPMSSGDISK